MRSWLPLPWLLPANSFFFFTTTYSRAHCNIMMYCCYITQYLSICIQRGSYLNGSFNYWTNFIISAFACQHRNKTLKLKASNSKKRLSIKPKGRCRLQIQTRAENGFHAHTHSPVPCDWTKCYGGLLRSGAPPCTPLCMPLSLSGAPSCTLRCVPLPRSRPVFPPRSRLKQLLKLSSLPRQTNVAWTGTDSQY